MGAGFPDSMLCAPSESLEMGGSCDCIEGVKVQSKQEIDLQILHHQLRVSAGISCSLIAHRVTIGLNRIVQEPPQLDIGQLGGGGLVRFCCMQF